MNPYLHLARFFHCFKSEKNLCSDPHLKLDVLEGKTSSFFTNRCKEKQNDVKSYLLLLKIIIRHH